ncbi:DUF2332 domain-containing protein [Actinomycetospora endophytica]|uniref:DUF2332 domain-containing protein n=1 Tax=Actinomycetospora endophytica TaxID=2291215 RepID=A0ABS8PE60_9PSEU|nr:DUF2332 domain-containing protein [Actinomycetospora endophytica]MCD2196562.1 DUF2332 domain-containing protein [Actinomycetospora endophytica]
MPDDEARDAVRDQALGIAAGWSPPDAPASWALTAELFRAIAGEDALLDLAAAIPADRLPPLLLSAALRSLIARERPAGLVGFFPTPGSGQPPLDAGFRPALAAFARDHAAELGRLCAVHRYQMNEVGRSADVLAVLADIAPDRPLALVDLGTGAGLGLQLDRYRYRFATTTGDTVVGDPDSPVELTCTVRAGHPPIPTTVPDVAARAGVDVEPLDLDDTAVRDWLAACIPPETGAVDRFAAASEIARGNPARLVRGDLVDTVAAVCTEMPADALLVLVDTYVHVFLPDDERDRFRALLPSLGRDLEWISVDPLVPLGPECRDSVQGLPVPARAVEACRAGVTGVVGRLSVRDGSISGKVLGLAHPGAAWLEWL